MEERNRNQIKDQIRAEKINSLLCNQTACREFGPSKIFELIPNCNKLKKIAELLGKKDLDAKEMKEIFYNILIDDYFPVITYTIISNAQYPWKTVKMDGKEVVESQKLHSLYFPCTGWIKSLFGQILYTYSLQNKTKNNLILEILKEIENDLEFKIVDRFIEYISKNFDKPISHLKNETDCYIHPEDLKIREKIIKESDDLKEADNKLKNQTLFLTLYESIIDNKKLDIEGFEILEAIIEKYRMSMILNPSYNHLSNVVNLMSNKILIKSKNFTIKLINAVKELKFNDIKNNSEFFNELKRKINEQKLDINRTVETRISKIIKENDTSVTIFFTMLALIIINLFTYVIISSTRRKKIIMI